VPDSIVCRVCQTENRADQKFCGNCGSALAQACPKCGTENPLNFQFCGSCGTKLEADAAPQPTEQRRWATVLFGDLSGFTSLSEGMDPEDVRSLIDRYMTRLGSIVEEHGGNVSAIAGDEIMALFGAPVAHEDDAERSVRAALEMQRYGLEHQDELGGLEMRIGINTGEMMFAPVGGSDRDFTVIGDAVNTASRLESAASPGGVLVGEETYRATRRTVTYHEKGSIQAKGKEQTVLAWEALEVGAVPEARPLGTAPLTGRDDELDLLGGIWQRVVSEGRPHLVTLLGDPGVGKSRLTAEFRRNLHDANILHGRCLAYGDALGYWALSTVLKQAAGITAGDTSEDARSKLGRLVEETSGSESASQDMAAHLALLTGLDLQADHAERGGDEKTLHKSARKFLESYARTQPLCLIFEDIHWAGDALLDLIESIARAVRAPILVLTQARPELLERRQSWGGGIRGYTSLPLEPLGQREIEELVAALCREHGLGEDVSGEASRGSEGNPLFAEELVAMLAEKGVASGVPSTIKGLVLARLDSLSVDERRAMQFGGVFGALVWEGGLRALGANGRLPETLDALEAKDLIRYSEPPQFKGEREYAFKHALIRDVAYDSIPKAERRTLHARAAGWIEEVAGERTDEYLDQLAHHVLEAGQQSRALEYLVRAAEKARRASAHRQEAVVLGQALELARDFGSETLADLHYKRGTAYSRVGAWAEARPELEMALELTEPSQTAQLASLRAELARVCFWLLDTPNVRVHAGEALRISHEANTPEVETLAIGLVAQADSADGNMEASLEGTNRALARAEELGSKIPYNSMPNLSLLLYWTGEYDESIHRGHQAIVAAREASDSSAMMWSLPQLGLSLAGSGAYADAIDQFDEALRFGKEYEVWTLLARATAMYAGVFMDTFDFERAEELQHEASELANSLNFFPPAVSASIDLLLNLARRGDVGRAETLVGGVTERVESGAGWHGWLWKLRLAEAKSEIAYARGRYDEAIEWATRAVDEGAAKMRFKYQVLGHISRAKALAASGNVDKTGADLREALSIARKLSDPSLILRAALASRDIKPGEEVESEARAAATRIVDGLPGSRRERFEQLDYIRPLIT
jgi:class 3 adenylate cyclase/tetratricopeptide (TPR) repeat protein